jgi:peptide/nickel transport system substrate-binding protein
MQLLKQSLIAALLVFLLSGCVQPITTPAADDSASTETSTAGSVLIEAASTDISSFNPLLATDAYSANIINLIFPRMLTRDPFTGQLSTEGAMAESWSVSDDGLTLTFKLRDNVQWSDGDNVDGSDFRFTFDALASEAVGSPNQYMRRYIDSITVVDPLTVEVKFTQVKCDALANLLLPWLPSHLYQPDFTDIADSPYNTAPPVSAGPLILKEWTPDESIVLVKNPTYWAGDPAIDGMIVKIVPDPAGRLIQLESGDVDFIRPEPVQLATVQAQTGVKVYSYPSPSFDFLLLNLADPANPQPGRDAEGALVPQIPHPILGDLNVRKAIAHSIDYDAVIDGIYLGRAYRIATDVLPATEWAHNAAVEPYTYDPDMAQGLLEEAGWTDTDGDGIRDKDGRPLRLTLFARTGRQVPESLAVLLQDQLKQVGIDVQVLMLDFGALVESLLAQEYDMAILGWSVSSDPNNNTLWESQSDLPTQGYNFTSYQNPRLDELLVAGYSAPGCRPEDRAPIYYEIQQILHDDVPAIFLAGLLGDLAYRDRWEGFDPGPWGYLYNIHQWQVRQ